MPLSPFAIRRGTVAMSRSVLAVVMGYISGLLFGMVAMLIVVTPGMLSAEGQTTYRFLVLVVGWVSSILAGYTTARIARKDVYKHVFALWVVAIVIFLVTLSLEGRTLPIWWCGLLLLGMMPSAWIGAWLKIRKK